MDYALGSVNVRDAGVDAVPPSLSEDLRRALSQLRDVASQVQDLRDAICGTTPTTGSGAGPLPPINGWADDMRSNALHAYDAGNLAFKNIHEIRAKIGV